jgi:hypothetical protein
MILLFMRLPRSEVGCGFGIADQMLYFGLDPEWVDLPPATLLPMQWLDSPATQTAVKGLAQPFSLSPGNPAAAAAGTHGEAAL